MVCVPLEALRFDRFRAERVYKDLILVKEDKALWNRDRLGNIHLWESNVNVLFNCHERTFGGEYGGELPIVRIN
jgi:hypothetical protein